MDVKCIYYINLTKHVIQLSNSILFRLLLECISDAKQTAFLTAISDSHCH